MSKEIKTIILFIILVFFSTNTPLYALTLTQSQSLSIGAEVPGPTNNNNNNGGGGGGGGSYVVPTGVTFSGQAYPLSKVTLLKDGQTVVTTLAGPDSKFLITLNNLTGGSYLFSIFTEDSSGRQSTLFTITVFITAGAQTTISGIFMSPTIAIDKSEVKKGENLAIFGQSTPSSDVVISVHSPQEVFVTTHSNSNGVYLYNLDTSFLDYGYHQTKSKASLTGEISPFGPLLTFSIGSSSIKDDNKCNVTADVNGDCRVNLVDFSILAFWYKRPNPPAIVDINKDGAVTIVDFSIMAYYWNG